MKSQITFLARPSWCGILAGDRIGGAGTEEVAAGHRRKGKSAEAGSGAAQKVAARGGVGSMSLQGMSRVGGEWLQWR